MTDDDVRYEFKSVRALRGMVDRTVVKWESQGWELTTKSPGALRVELTFRRGRPKAPNRRTLATIGGVVAVGIIVSIGAATGGNDSTTTGAPAGTSTAPSQMSDPQPGKVAAESASEPTLTPAERETAAQADKENVKRAKKKAEQAQKNAEAAEKKKAQEKQDKQDRAKKAAEQEREEAKRVAARTRADAKLTFSNCTAMNRTYPHGVGKPGARDDSSGSGVTSFKRDSHIYELNGSSDGDDDGIACEKP